MSAAKKFLQFMSFIDKISGYIVAFMMAAMVVLISYQVFTRYTGFLASSAWTEEIARFLMIWAVMLAAAMCIRTHELLAIDLIPSLIGPKAQKILKLMTYVCNMVVYAIIIYYGFPLCAKVINQIAPGSKMSMVWPYLALPLCGVYMVFNTIAVTIENFIEEPTPKEEEEMNLSPM